MIRKFTQKHYGYIEDCATRSVLYMSDPEAQVQILNELKHHGSSQVCDTANDIEHKLLIEDDKLKDYKLQIKKGDFIVSETVMRDKEDMKLFTELLTAYKSFIKKQ